MKVYSIGREENCDIVIDDRTDVISRRHAALNVTSMGKMTIVDYSHNGTYVNGIRISQNVPVPVTRKDNISFAHVARLDWRMIPNTQAKMITYIIMAVVAILLVIGGVWAYKSLNSGSASDTPELQQPTAVVDSTATKPKEEPKDSLKEKKDSVKAEAPKVVLKPKTAGGKGKGKTGKKEEPKPEPKKEEPQKRFR